MEITIFENYLNRVKCNLDVFLECSTAGVFFRAYSQEPPVCKG